ncbi:MAG: response regulator [Leptospirales bacterium]
MAVALKDMVFSTVRGGKRRVLVVEDDGVALDLLEEILKRGGFLVSVAQSYEEALHRLTSDRISLILTDLKMPGKTGMDLLRSVKDLYPDLPVILLTAFGDEHLWVEALSSGAVDLIPKPFKKQEILEVVTRTLDRSGSP